MTSSRKIRVLCVDDDPNILSGIRRNLGRRYDITVAEAPAAALELVKSSDPFTVVVSDYRMPSMDGAMFLSMVRDINPDTIRVLLTGQADMNGAVSAVNQGHIYRFLWKPCSMPDLESTIEDAAEQYRLVTAERILLEQTLKGCIKTLTDLLSLANPAAFGRAARAKEQALLLADEFELDVSRWELEIAVMLSQIGCVTLPPDTAARLYHGEKLSETELAAVRQIPVVAAKLLSNIPRIERIRKIVEYQDQNFDGSGRRPGTAAGKEIPLGARILKVVLDFDLLEAAGIPASRALDEMAARVGTYDPDVLDAFASLKGATQRAVVRKIPFKNLEAGMVLAADVVTQTGLLLMARGQEVTAGVIARLNNMAGAMSVAEPIKVRVPAEDTGHNPTIHSTQTGEGQVKSHDTPSTPGR